MEDHASARSHKAAFPWYDCLWSRNLPSTLLVRPFGIWDCAAAPHRVTPVMTPLSSCRVHPTVFILRHARAQRLISPYTAGMASGYPSYSTACGTYATLGTPDGGASNATIR